MTYSLVPHPDYGFPQVRPTPPPEEISEYYSREFYSGDYRRLNDSSLEVQLADDDFFRRQRLDICRQLTAITGRPSQGTTLLDVGCGWGRALLHFRGEGMECFGFDPAPEAVEYARDAGLNVVHAGVDRMDAFGTRRFDVVTLLNVAEHLADPVAAVAEIRERVLVPGGVLIIDVPNEFNRFQLAGQKAHDLDEWWVTPPAHLNYFSATTLRRMLEGEGFEVPLVKSSFPMELFLLFGLDYVRDSGLGRTCHEQRTRFEEEMGASGNEELLHEMYVWMAAHDLGRQVTAFARSSST